MNTATRVDKLEKRAHTGRQSVVTVDATDNPAAEELERRCVEAERKVKPGGVVLILDDLGPFLE